jgi:peptide/nickel transport system ATP-binding protein
VPDDTPALVEVDDAARHFDASPPWIDRVLRGKPRVAVKAVDGVTLSIRRGETFALVGESGCGKSTLARLLVGLYRATRGEIRFDGAAVGAQRFQRRVQMIFQDPYSSLNPRLSAASIIAEPIRTHGLTAGRDIRRRVDELLGLVGLASADGDKYPHEFSGGQRQRISIARALAGEPEFIVCDEPTSALDVSVQAQILNLMKDLQRDLRLTYLFISHNLAVVRHMADIVGVMYLGRLVEVAPADALFAHPMHPYTRLLLDALPDIDMTGRARSRPIGEPANPADPPSGCAFHPRCVFANERCRRELPVRRAMARGEGSIACHAAAEGRLPWSDAREVARFAVVP